MPSTLLIQGGYLSHGRFVFCFGGTKEGQSVLLVPAVSQVTLIQIISMPMRHIWGRSILLPFRFIIYYWIPGAEIAFWTWTLLFSLCFHSYRMSCAELAVPSSDRTLDTHCPAPAVFHDSISHVDLCP